MTKVTFKGKPEKIYSMEGEYLYSAIKIPKLTKRHCDSTIHQHPKLRGISNSPILDAALGRISRELSKDGYLYPDKLPENVTIDDTKLLWVVTIAI